MTTPSTEAGKALAAKAKRESWSNWEGLAQFTIPAIEDEARRMTHPSQERSTRTVTPPTTDNEPAQRLRDHLVILRGRAVRQWMDGPAQYDVNEIDAALDALDALAAERASGSAAMRVEYNTGRTHGWEEGHRAAERASGGLDEDALVVALKRTTLRITAPDTHWINLAAQVTGEYNRILARLATPQPGEPRANGHDSDCNCVNCESGPFFS